MSEFIYPKISVITPSYNQGHFIEETILSVIGQHYPNLEYIIMDGGSNDNTVAVIQKYEQFVTYWQSRKDKGQSDAINQGFEKATGDILLWLNSDDMLMPGALHEIALQYTNSNNKDVIFFGNCINFKQVGGKLFCESNHVEIENVVEQIKNYDFIVQPSSFWSKSVWQKVGVLQTDMHYAFDWEWFLRAVTNGTELKPVHKCLSLYRIHGDHKSATGGNKRQLEIIGLYQQYSPFYHALSVQLTNDLKNKRLVYYINRIYSVLNIGDGFLRFLRYYKYGFYKSYTFQQIKNCYLMLI